MNIRVKPVLLICLTLAGLFILANLIAVGFGEWNYHRLKAGVELEYTSFLQDGGTRIYSGFGYDLWNLNGLDGLRGQRIEYAQWVLWKDHEDIFFER